MSKKAKDAAKEILDRFGSKVPIDIDAIVKAYDISVVVEELETSVSGILMIESKHIYIVLNLFHPEGRKRFTQAHELGHFLLHRDSSKVFIDETPLFRKDEPSKPVVDPKEVEANVFAAELLMPEDVLRTDLDEKPLKAGDEGAVRKLATRYGVSTVALKYRLKGLGLISK
jgi:Zn-dependent peptidase ImmA (M78 family)